jgi:hypothetical protein
MAEPISYAHQWWTRRDEDQAILRWNQETESWDEWQQGEPGSPPPEFTDVRKGRGDRQRKLDQQTQAARVAAEKAAGIIYETTSHEQGRNSKVTLYSDRIERVKERRFGSMGRANQDADVIPIRSVSSVQAKKDGLVYTKVTVFASGNTIEFRIGHDEAIRFKNEIQRIILSPSQAPASQQTHSPTPDPLDQLRKLAELKQMGAITDEEFQAKKEELLNL